MLCICFHLRQQVYAIRVTSVLRVLPRLQVKPLPYTPDWFCGLIRVAGEGVPLVDFSQLVIGEPSRVLYSTRIILLRCMTGQQARTLGLLTEGVTGTLKFREESLHHLAVHLAQAPYLTETLTDERGMVQLIDVDQLFSDELSELLAHA